jgi:hypothetical protein
VYSAAVIGSAALVWLVPDLIWLNVAAQVLNAFVMPLAIGLLVALAATALPAAHRLRGGHLWLVTAAAGLVCAVGLFGAIRGLL